MSHSLPPADELEIGLNDPKREPETSCLEWKYLNPPAGQAGDWGEHQTVYDTISRLWNRMQDRTVRNRQDLELWVEEARAIKVCRALCSPGAIFEAFHQDRHSLLQQHNRELRDNRWLARIDMMLLVAPALLEVGPTTIASVHLC